MTHIVQSAPDREKAFELTQASLVDAVKFCYQNMDDPLRFPQPEKKEQPPPEASLQEIKPELSKDFRGVVCPLNFVKTKLALEQISSGEVREVLLDEEGAKNVPGSVSSEGHEVLSVTREGARWRILTRKA